MPWNQQVAADYIDLLAGPLGDALELGGPAYELAGKALVFEFLHALETGQARQLEVVPATEEHLTLQEYRLLHAMRAACCLYLEYRQVYPWRLVGRPIEVLRPLLSRHYMGFVPWRVPIDGALETVYRPYMIWDLKPGLRMMEGILGRALMSLFGNDPPATEWDMVVFQIQSMRDRGWRHGGLIEVEYAAYPRRDVEAVREVLRGGCHHAGTYLVAELRAVNVPANLGRNLNIDLDTTSVHERILPSASVEDGHRHAMCHFPGIERYIQHNDDVHASYLRYVSPEFILRTEAHMAEYQWGRSHYLWSRGLRRETLFWWCISLAENPEFSFYDLPRRYELGLLRGQLENAHQELISQNYPGTPAVVPPLFDTATIDALMNWVATKLGP